jgi:hypothetical protein
MELEMLRVVLVGMMATGGGPEKRSCAETGLASGGGLTAGKNVVTVIGCEAGSDGNIPPLPVLVVSG